MTTQSEADEPGTGTPNETFDILGSETRIQILWALWEAFEPHGDANALPFSELYDRVDISNSGNFNYHLEKVVGAFVDRSDSGYELTPAGFTLTQSLLAGTMTGASRFGPTEIDARCPLCGASIEVAYEAKHVTCHCTECDGTWPSEGGSGYLVEFHFPPGGVRSRSPEEVFRAAISRAFGRVSSFLDGVCPDCSGSVTSALNVCLYHDTGTGNRCQSCNRPHMIEVEHVCRTCKWPARGPARAAVLTHPVVTAFYHDHGVEHQFASWAAFRRSHEVEEELISEEPLEFKFSIPAEEERLDLTVDGELRLIESTRC